jgi:hypothetical protein
LSGKTLYRRPPVDHLPPGRRPGRQGLIGKSGTQVRPVATWTL